MTSRSRGIVTKRGLSQRKVKFDFSEVEGWEQVLRSQGARIGRASRQAERKNARELARRARRNAPRSRGRRSKASKKYGPLRSQIKARNTSHVASAGIGTAFYGAFQEFGTKRIPARPFFGPAIKRQRRDFVNDARTIVRKILTRSGLHI